MSVNSDVTQVVVVLCQRSAVPASAPVRGHGVRDAQPAVDLAETISANGIWVSLGIVAVMVGWQWARRRVTAHTTPR